MKTDEEILQDLIEVIHFTENVSAKIHGVLDEAEVYRIVKEGFAESKRYTVSILLLTEDGSKIKIVETSLSPEKWNVGEKVTGLRLKEFEIDLNKSSIYSQVIRKGKTVEVNVNDTIGELFPRPLAYLLSKTLGYQKKKSILTPLYKRGKIIGALAMSSTDLSQYLIPSVRNLAQHISNTLELAYEINEREKEVKEALAKSENLLSNIIEQSPFSTWIADAKGTNIRQNAACRKLFGIDCDEQTVGKYNIFSDPMVKEQGLTEELRKVFSEGKTIKFTVDYDFSKVKHVNVPHATHRILHATIFPIKDENGKIINAVVQHEDITERKKAEEALVENEEKFRNLAEQSPSMIWVNKRGTVVYANRKCEEIMGYKKEEFYSPDFNFLDLITPEYHDLMKTNFHKHMQGQDTPSFECVLVTKEGKRIDAIHTTKLITLGGETAILGILTDITDRKKAEEEKEKLQAQLMQSAKMAAVGTLASGITHGFSNLLQIMVGHVAFAQRTKKREDMKHALNIVLDTSDRATKIIKDLLTFSKPELSEKELCDITEPIESVLSLAEEQLKKHNIKVVRKYERTPAIEVNKAEIQQVFLAIVINARDAVLPKGGKLEICVKQVKGNIEVSFSDTGKGIEKENLSKVFEPFYTTKGAFGGSTIPGIGLGLPVSYGIIQRHRGTIEVNSQVGQRTTFTVKLPVKEVRPKESIEEQKKKEIENAQYMNILVMDDEQEICKILINWLSTEGYRVKSVLTGREAIELVKDEYFNVAFLDIIMPGIPGNIVLEEIKKISPETKVVMITGKLMNDYLLNKLIQKGASGCIQKPFGIEEIKEALV